MSNIKSVNEKGRREEASDTGPPPEPQRSTRSSECTQNNLERVGEVERALITAACSREHICAHIKGVCSREQSFPLMQTFLPRCRTAYTRC